VKTTTIKKIKEALLVTSKATGLEINAETPKHILKSCEQKAGKYHNINIGYKSFEGVVNFKYSETCLRRPRLRKFPA
jgi:hypothetical protein